MNLKQTYREFMNQPFANKEVVSRRMFQIFDLALRDEKVADSTNHIVTGIVASEEVLLRRTDYDVNRNGSALRTLRKAMRASSQEEWDELMQELNIPPLSSEDQLKLFQFGSGITGKDFIGWVLGNEGQSGNKEIR